jgi:6,7-dimethyl-8-ribityllumazine synthase
MYYKKYLKYKQKYLQLKNNYLQIGGGPPLVENIKNINLFELNSEKYKFLSPIWGFIWFNTGLINNYYNFYNKYNDTNDSSIEYKTGKFVNRLFFKVNLEELVRPTKECFASKQDTLTQDDLKKDDPYKIEPYQIGLLLGLKFFNLKNNELITELKKNPYGKILLTKVNYVNKYNKCYQNKIITFINKTNSLDDAQYIFHVILTYLWYMADDKTDFIEYYNGINDAICRFNALFHSIKEQKITIPEQITIPDIDYIVIPDNFLDIYRRSDFLTKETDDFELVLTDTFKKGNSIPIYSQHEVNYYDSKYGYINYPDCGESTLRTFLNIILYDPITLKFNLDILSDLKAIDNLKEYYRVFDDFVKQTNNKKNYIFEQNLNARDAWSYVVSNLEKVKYAEHNGTYYYEIDGGLAADNYTLNFLQVIMSLLTNIKKLEDIATFYNRSPNKNPSHNITINFINLSKGTGLINLVHNINGTYEINLMESHFYVRVNNSSDNYIKYNSEDEEKQNIILFIKKNVKISEITDKYFMYVKYNDDLLIIVFNTIELSEKNYRLLFNYIIKNYKEDRDKLSRCKIDISKIETELYKEELYCLNKVYKNYIKFDEENEFKHKNIINLFVYNIIEFKSFDNLHTLAFDMKFNQEITENVLPGSLHTLDLGFEFNKEIKKNVLPGSLHTLILSNKFNKEIKEDVLPGSLHTLIFGYEYNIEIKHSVLPSNLHTLTFGDRYNKEIKHSVLPSNLHTLTFGNTYNKEIKECVLPSKLHTLTFGKFFLHEIKENVLPKSLHTLTLSSQFNKKIKEKLLPVSLHTLIFGEKFNQEINMNELPDSLHTLTFGFNFNQEIKENVLPSLLHTLTFGYYFNKVIIENILPVSLHTLTFGEDFNQEIKKNVLPNSLHTLTFGSSFNKEIKENVLPDSLHTLTFSIRFNQEIKDNVLPDSLHTLEFGEQFNQEIKVGVLPEHLHTLVMGHTYNTEIKVGVLPEHLHTLVMGYSYNTEIKERVLPEYLHTLDLGSTYNIDINVAILPISIKKIFLSVNCNLINNLPSHIEEVYIRFNRDDTRNKKINTLPTTLKKIYIQYDNYLKYITNIPDGCKIVIEKFN